MNLTGVERNQFGHHAQHYDTEKCRPAAHISDSPQDCRRFRRGIIVRLTATVIIPLHPAAPIARKAASDISVQHINRDVQPFSPKNDRPGAPQRLTVTKFPAIGPPQFQSKQRLPRRRTGKMQPKRLHQEHQQSAKQNVQQADVPRPPPNPENEKQNRDNRPVDRKVNGPRKKTPPGTVGIRQPPFPRHPRRVCQVRVRVKSTKGRFLLHQRLRRTFYPFRRSLPKVEMLVQEYTVQRFLSPNHFTYLFQRDPH